jgi:hypothetical protein
VGQQEVYSFLKRNRKAWFTARQITRRIRLSFGSVVTSLKRLRDSNQVTYKKVRKKSCSVGRRVLAYKFK